MTSRIIWMISNISPSIGARPVSVIRLMDIFVAFPFFQGAVFLGLCGRLSWVDAESGSTCSFVLSPSPVCYSVDISWPSLGLLVGTVVVSAIYVATTASTAYCCMATSCSWRLLSASCAMCSLVSFICC